MKNEGRRKNVQQADSSTNKTNDRQGIQKKRLVIGLSK
jgi:hypothetical protein